MFPFKEEEEGKEELEEELEVEEVVGEEAKERGWNRNLRSHFDYSFVDVDAARVCVCLGLRKVTFFRSSYRKKKVIVVIAKRRKRFGKRRIRRKVSVSELSVALS